MINGVTVRGLVTHTVRLDTTAPNFSALTGSGAGFYPYPDGFRDTFTPAVTLNEAGVLTLAVRTSGGQTVRVLRMSEPAGRVSLTWNGRDAANHQVAAGTYRWSYSVVDAASNARSTAGYTVSVSSQRLVAKSAVLTRNGVSTGSGAGIPRLAYPRVRPTRTSTRTGSGWRICAIRSSTDPRLSQRITTSRCRRRSRTRPWQCRCTEIPSPTRPKSSLVSLGPLAAPSIFPVMSRCGRRRAPGTRSARSRRWGTTTARMCPRSPWRR